MKQKSEKRVYPVSETLLEAWRSRIPLGKAKLLSEKFRTLFGKYFNNPCGSEGSFILSNDDDEKQTKTRKLLTRIWSVVASMWVVVASAWAAIGSVWDISASMHTA